MRTEREVLETNISVVEKSVDRLESLKVQRKLTKAESARYRENTRLLNRWKKELSILKVLEA